MTEKHSKMSNSVLFAALLLLIGANAQCGHNGCCYCNAQGEKVAASTGRKYEETCVIGCKF